MSSSDDHGAPDDDQLLPRIAAGDEEAFVALFRRRRPEVYRFALHMTASTAAAEDITQDVFLAVMHDAQRYQPGRATVVAWMLGIARNHVRRRAERERFLHPVAELDEASHPWAAASVGDPLGALTNAEQIAILRRAILSLPLRYRETVVLCDLQELSYADAAAALGCAVGTLRSRLHRARALLTDKVRAAHAARTGASLRGTGCFA